LCSFAFSFIDLPPPFQLRLHVFGTSRDHLFQLLPGLQRLLHAMTFLILSRRKQVDFVQSGKIFRKQLAFQSNRPLLSRQHDGNCLFRGAADFGYARVRLQPGQNALPARLALTRYKRIP